MRMRSRLESMKLMMSLELKEQLLKLKLQPVRTWVTLLRLMLLELMT